ncbi:MAG TPA: DUF177 domain-containing protein [Candidatus Limnocylindrales bacterium]|nr:DUF177 domain-containing protein [Candidatus Limnocylindrales bacterium]
MSDAGSHPYPVDTHGDPLTFAVSGVLADVPGTLRDYAVEDVDVDPGEALVLAEPVNGTIRVTRTNRGLVVDAKLRTALAGECARCLRPLVTPVTMRIDEEVLPTIDLGSGLPVPLEEDGDPEAPRLTDHHELEMRPLVAEAISLQEPIAPLCEPDCPGLCTECGERLETGHGHGEGPIDPRLEALRAFRFDAGDESG